MSQENVEIVRRGVGGSMRGRAAALAAGLVALACLLSTAAPVRADAATAFRQVTVPGDPPLLESDGVRFVTLGVTRERDSLTAPWVFDTLARRRVRLTPPFPGCLFWDVGGDVALWQCADYSRYMVTDLATGAAREPAGWAAVEAIESQSLGYHCIVYLIGRYWLQGDCGFTTGDRSDLFYLNHRTGRLLEASSLRPRYPELLSGSYAFQRINLDYRGLVTPRCGPLRQGRSLTSVPPFGLQVLLWRVDEYDGVEYGNILLRRCGERRAQIVSRCPSNNCAAAQLGSRYVTWAEGNRVFAYLPRARRRVVVAPAPAGSRIWERPVNVVHTCDRVFAQWPDALYVARFEPRGGAPPCQTRSRSDTARTSTTSRD